MRQFAFTARAATAIALASAVSSFAGAASAGSSGLVPQLYSGAPVVDAYESFTMSKAPAPAWAVADGGYGSQGFHHGLPAGASAGDVFAVNMIPYGGSPDTAAAPQVEPVAGGAGAMRDASIFTYTPDADYGSRDIGHWLPQYRQD
jgi:hypothetical protein